MWAILSLKRFYPSISPQDVELAGIDSTKALVVRFDYDTKLPEGKDSAFQVALLYTNRLGERRLRVHTLSLRTSSVLADIFRGADMDAVLTAMPKMLVSDVPKVPLGQLRGKITAKVGGWWIGG